MPNHSQPAFREYKCRDCKQWIPQACNYCPQCGGQQKIKLIQLLGYGEYRKEINFSEDVVEISRCLSSRPGLRARLAKYDRWCEKLIIQIHDPDRSSSAHYDEGMVLWIFGVESISLNTRDWDADITATEYDDGHLKKVLVEDQGAGLEVKAERAQLCFNDFSPFSG